MLSFTPSSQAGVTQCRFASLRSVCACLSFSSSCAFYSSEAFMLASTASIFVLAAEIYPCNHQRLPCSKHELLIELSFFFTLFCKSASFFSIACSIMSTLQIGFHLPSCRAPCTSSSMSTREGNISFTAISILSSYSTIPVQ